MSTIRLCQRRQKMPLGPRCKINVTTELIENSKIRHSSHCMIAEAVKVAVPGARTVAVDLQTIRFTDPRRPLRFIYLTPRIAQIGLVKFDQGDADIEPFSFMLRGAHVIASGHVRGQSATTRAKQGQSDSLQKAAVVQWGKRLRIRGDFNTPVPVGGQAPPVTAFARRRAFGLRALAL